MLFKAFTDAIRFFVDNVFLNGPSHHSFERLTIKSGHYLLMRQLCLSCRSHPLCGRFEGSVHTRGTLFLVAGRRTGSCGTGGGGGGVCWEREEGEERVSVRVLFC